MYAESMDKCDLIHVVLMVPCRACMCAQSCSQRSRWYSCMPIGPLRKPLMTYLASMATSMSPSVCWASQQSAESSARGTVWSPFAPPDAQAMGLRSWSKTMTPHPTLRHLGSLDIWPPDPSVPAVAPSGRLMRPARKAPPSWIWQSSCC